jgi:predicted PurR-regulated permease PerM
MNRSWSTPTRLFVLAAILIVAGLVLWQTRELLKPLITAGLIAYLMYPLVELMNARLKIGRKPASRLVYFVGVGLIIVLPLVLAPIVYDEIQAIAGDLLRTLDQLARVLEKPVFFGGVRLHLETLVPELKRSLTTFMTPAPEEALELLEQTSRNTLWFLIILVSTYYFMTDWDKAREGLIRLAPAEYQNDVRRLYLEIKQVWMAYLRGQLTLMTVVAVVFTIIWSVIGLPGALVLGLLAGLFSLVPDVGPLAATVLALVVALLEGSNWLPLSNFWFAMLVAGLYVVLINIKNIWLRPLILGRSVRMHEGIVFVAIIAAVVFTGIIGAFIVVPVLASLGVVGRYTRRRLLGLAPFDDDEPATHGPPRALADQENPT